jgi:hypothetical protein
VSLAAFLVASYLLAYSVVVLLGYGFYSAIGTALFPWLVAAVIAAGTYWKRGKRPSHFKVAWVVLVALLFVLAYPTMRG